MLAKSPAPETPATTTFTFPDLTKASTIGLCYLLDALHQGGDGLFAPCRESSYPADMDADVTAKVRYEILEIISELAALAEEELKSRPVPEDQEVRALRARILVNRHMLSYGDSSFEDGAFAQLAEGL